MSNQTSAIESKDGLLPATAPFDFQQTLRFLGSFPPIAGEQTIIQNRLLTKAISLKGQAVVFKVTAAEQVGINYTLYAKKLDDEIIALAERAISKFLGLQDDLTKLYQVGAQDKAFAPILKKLYGYHQVRFLTPFENAAWSVLTQRTPIAVARASKFKLVERYGSKLEIPGEKTAYTTFPEPATLVASDPAELLTLLNNERKADYLRHVAQAFATELRFDDPGVDELDRETLKQKLLAIKGIGAWSAEFVLIRGFGKMGGIPGGEKELIKAVSRWYAPNRDDLVTDEEVTNFARPYGDSKGYWAHYLRVAGAPD